MQKPTEKEIRDQVEKMMKDFYIARKGFHQKEETIIKLLENWKGLRE